eukprot:gene3435-3900_t
MAPPRKHQANSFTNRVNKSNVQTNPDRVLPKGATHMRSKATINRINMYSARPIRTRDGKFVSGAYMSKDTSHDTRIAPDRRWFGNTRSVSQDQLEKFRTEMADAVDNPFKVLLKANKLPLGLLQDSTKKASMNLLTTESFATTFGPKKQRKRPNLPGDALDYDKLVDAAGDRAGKYDEEKDSNIRVEEEKITRRLDIFDKGTSKRIWGELYKVIDSSDVLVQVLDARDPMGTRSKHLESTLKKTAKHKHLIFILNKCDLVPTWATARWVKLLSREYPTLAFHASITNPFGKGALIQLLRQFSKLHSDKKQISVGFIGYPNVGKSSIINTLKSKRVCKAAPIPGETKVWQYITLMKRIYLIDCPGVVPATGDSEANLVLKGVVRVENLEDATEYIPEVLKRIKKEYLMKTYGIVQWEDYEDFLKQMAEKTGKLLKKNQPNLNACAKMILYDFQRGKIPYFLAPPTIDEAEAALEVKPEEEDPEDKNEPEEVKKKKAEIAASLVVNQKLKKINVKAEFFGDEDAKGDEYIDPFDEEPDWDELYQKKEDGDLDYENILEDVPVTKGKKAVPAAAKKAAPVIATKKEKIAKTPVAAAKAVPSTATPAVKKEKKKSAAVAAVKKEKKSLKPLGEDSDDDYSEVDSDGEKKKQKDVEGRHLVLIANIDKKKENATKKANPKIVPRNQYRENIPDVGSEDEGLPRKEKRKTTNKDKAGVHFYETANGNNTRVYKKIIEFSIYLSTTVLALYPPQTSFGAYDKELYLHDVIIQATLIDLVAITEKSVILCGAKPQIDRRSNRLDDDGQQPTGPYYYMEHTEEYIELSASALLEIEEFAGAQYYSRHKWFFGMDDYLKRFNEAHVQVLKSKIDENGEFTRTLWEVTVTTRFTRYIVSELTLEVRDDSLQLRYPTDIHGVELVAPGVYRLPKNIIEYGGLHPGDYFIFSYTNDSQDKANFVIGGVTFKEIVRQ